jgi:4-amino-4-deoxy-L-arabinose transferase-like glycosyltransferase
MKQSVSGKQGLVILGLIWLAGVLLDRFWFSLDHSVPDWDRADYLNGALNYYKALQTPAWLDGQWWRQLWLMSPKIPPLTYLLTVPFLHFFGLSQDAATLVMVVFTALLLGSVYSLGVILFDVSVGLWAALLCQLMPGLYVYRLQFLLDFPLAAIVSFSFCCLTLWYFSEEKTPPLVQWLRAIAWGFSLGIAFLLKQTALFFLFCPLAWALLQILKNRQWERLGQYLSGLLVAVAIFYPWYRTNWLLMLTSGKRATIDSALIEGDPSLTSLDAWTYYLKVLPYFLSWVLLIVPLVGFLLNRFYGGKKRIFAAKSAPIWLGVFLIGGYLFSSLNINKDARYILPLLPVLSLVLALGLLSWPGRYRFYPRWIVLGIGLLLMACNLFPLGGISSKMQHHPYRGRDWPHREVIREILETSPYLQSTLGVLPSTKEINQHTLSFYGKSFPSSIIGRQVGVREKELEADRRSLDWFLLKSQDQGSIPKSQAKMSQGVEKDPDLPLQKSWTLPDGSNLLLYHRLKPGVDVGVFPLKRSPVRLEKITLPATAPPNQPIPVTYQWTGNFAELQSGLVLLTWRQVDGGGKWLQDQGIGMGRLDGDKLTEKEKGYTYQVTERTAMFPENAPTGDYTLEATYLNRQTGETYPISTPKITLTLDTQAAPSIAPELDLVTQVRLAAKDLNLGIKGLEPIFKLTARINQYDATQDYVKQLDQSLSQRLKTEKRLDWAYGVALAKILQQDVEGAIGALNRVIEIEPNNPYHYGYLAFVYLYDWRPSEAQNALKLAQEINPSIPELKLLEGVAAIMGGNLLKGWQILSQTKLP